MGVPPLLGLLTSLYYVRRGQPLEPERGLAILELLDGLPTERLRRALKEAAREDRVFPDLPSIRARVVRELTEAERRVDPETVAAIERGAVWCEVCEDTGWIQTTREAPGYAEPVPAVSRCRCHPGHRDHRRNPYYEARVRRSRVAW